MTFIASVIAKDGIAIVADSFRTTVTHSLDEEQFVDYLSNRKDKAKTSIPLTDIVRLFEEKASHTRNYVDKLSKFDEDSAVATSGAAYINRKEIKDIVRQIAAEMQADLNAYNAKSIEDKLQEFCDKIKIEVLDHLKNLSMGETDFIFSHYNRTKNEPQVFIIKIKKIDKDKYDPADTTLVTYEERTSLGIITDGQDTFVDRLIFGSLYTNMHRIKKGVLNYIFKKCKPKKTKKDEITKEINHIDFLKDTVTGDVFSIKFRELSLQEAVDLVSLLIKIVMDIQVYTEKIPTVGGVIRLAVISKDKGFEWISGDKIIPPKII